MHLFRHRIKVFACFSLVIYSFSLWESKSKNLHCFIVFIGYMTLTFSSFIGWLGWSISDESIRSGLEHTHLLGRSQFLSSEEAEVLGLTGATVLLDGGLVLWLFFYYHDINWGKSRLKKIWLHLFWKIF